MSSSRPFQLSAVATVVLASVLLIAGAGVVISYLGYGKAEKARLEDSDLSPLLVDVLKQAVKRLYGDEYSLGAGEICHLQIDVHMTGGICKVVIQSPTTPNDRFEVYFDGNGGITKQTGKRIATILPQAGNVVSLSQLLVASIERVLGDDRRLRENEGCALDLKVKQKLGTWEVDLATGNSPGSMFWLTFDHDGQMTEFGGGM